MLLSAQLSMEILQAVACIRVFQKKKKSLSSIVPSCFHPTAQIDSNLTEKSFWMSASWLALTNGHRDSLWLFRSVSEHALLILSQSRELSYTLYSQWPSKTSRSWGWSCALTARWDGAALKLAAGRNICERRKG